MNFFKKIKTVVKNEIKKQSKRDLILMASALSFSILFFIGCIFTALINRELNSNIVPTQVIASDSLQKELTNTTPTSDNNNNNDDNNYDNEEEENNIQQEYIEEPSSSPSDFQSEYVNNVETITEPEPNYSKETETYSEPVQSYTTQTSEYIQTSVWIGETGTKYHRYSCSTLSGNKYEITLHEALNQGREPCKRCKP